MSSTPVITIDPGNPDPSLIQEAAGLLRQGRILAYPTETFYGLGADAGNEAAIEKLFGIKGRSFSNPIPILMGAEDELDSLVEEVPETARRLMGAFWPGPLTLVFRAAPSLSPRLTAHTGLIGIRISSHPIARSLAQALGAPLTTTSANLSGGKECVTAQEVARTIGSLLDGIVDGGRTPGLAGSTVVNVTEDPPQLLRVGMIPEGEITKVLRGRALK
ncbi:MAG: Threonylcarbamoyl-AMP synthase [Syntrophus sp. PtaU1.Bin005]|jgi:L-threonylcarbamoyladenylate synthase|nr:MAG: Threonylcarbamoyl-AMP synthase [Syntrophus sp. PtaU1.Bin005]